VRSTEKSVFGIETPRRNFLAIQKDDLRLESVC
jgi:hypothetical protein